MPISILRWSLTRFPGRKNKNKIDWVKDGFSMYPFTANTREKNHNSGVFYKL